MGGVSTAKAVALALSVCSLIGALYGFYGWLDSTLVTKRERAMSDLSLIMAIQENRITTLEMHEATLTLRQKDELAGLRHAKKANECERQKLAELLAPEHSCAQ